MYLTGGYDTVSDTGKPTTVHVQYIRWFVTVNKAWFPVEVEIR